MIFKQKYINLCIPAPHWYIGLLGEKKVRSKDTNLTVIPLIQWEQLNNGQWTDLKVVNTDPNIQHTFTLNLTINHGKMMIQLQQPSELNKLYSNNTDMGADNGTVSNTTVVKMIETQQMRTYDELRELDVEETPESLR